ncbi:MAG TPA: S-layer homology domain-containing protein, partial [Pseudoflavonifractor sp.]|nr:S-layer homology domain-containing protein [Pseudoflavonifractor sp.]
MKRLRIKFPSLLFVLGLLSGLLSVSVGAVSADSLADLSQVTHREAVLLMTDLGVIQGKTDGTYAPKESVDRATMAKLLYGILMGETSPMSFASVDTGLTDIAGNWAENYIKYCYSVGIISGKGNGTFDPASVVNVASAAKMLLVTLGYDAVDRGYASDPLWADNITRDAEALGLLDGITQYSFEPLTRDNAAQMLYNALFAYTRTPNYALRNGEQTIVNYTTNPTTLGLEVFDLLRYTILVGDTSVTQGPPSMSYFSIFPRGGTITDKADIMEQIRSGKAGFAIGPELAGSYAVLYVKADWSLSKRGTGIEKLTLEGIYSSALTPKPLPILGSSAAGVPIAGDETNSSDLTTPSAENATFLAPLNTSVTYFINGIAATLPGANRAASTRGAVVDLLDSNGDGKADMVKVTVKYTGILTDDVESRQSGGQALVRFPGVSGLSDWTDGNTVLGGRGLKKGDGVLAVKIGSTTYVEKAITVSGYAMALEVEGDSVLKVDGREYHTSGLLTGEIPGWSGVAGSYEFYLDNNGDIFGANS